MGTMQLITLVCILTLFSVTIHMLSKPNTIENWTQMSACTRTCCYHLFLSVKQIQDIYQLLQDVQTILLDANVSFIIGGGTLLGAARHQSLIPWDDNVDLYVFNKQGLKNAYSAFEDKGLEVHNQLNKTVIKYPGRPFPELQIYTMKLSADGQAYEPDDMALKKKFPNLRIQMDEAREMTGLRFGPVKDLPAPKHYDRLLVRMFGKEYMTMGDIRNNISSYLQNKSISPELYHQYQAAKTNPLPVFQKPVCV
jgi:hypothetical protein